MSSPTQATKCYTGRRVCGRAVVEVNVLGPAGVTTYELPHVVRHSPDGFNYGYGGSGPADLARSILIDCLGADPQPALYHAFKFEFLAPLDQDGAWQITEGCIRQWVSSRPA